MPLTTITNHTTMKIILLSFILLAACVSCQNKQADERVEQLEKATAHLKVENQKLKKASEQSKVAQANKDYQLNKQVLQSSTITSLPQEVGTVELWTYKEVVSLDGNLNRVVNHKLIRTGEGSVYVNHTQYGNEYELRYVNNGNSYTYHVALGNFTVETDDGVMQFNAHAGAHYFDL